MRYDKIVVPADGERIAVNRDGTIDVPGATLVGTSGSGAAVVRHMDD